MGSPNSRAGLVAMLVAAEILIAGFAIYTLRGSGNIVSVTGGMHSVDYAAPSFAPIAAGIAPNVTIDDMDSKVIVTTSSDGMVHVTDKTQVHGLLFGTAEVAKLQVHRTLDGVNISRPEGHFFLGDSTNRIAVEVPPMTHLTIARSGGDEITGLRNGIDVTSQDGRIYLTDITGNVKAHSDSGRVIATHLSANSVDLTSNDGRIEVSQLEMTGLAPRANLHTDDGPLLIAGVFPALGNYTLTTNDGHVDLSLAQGSSATVSAATGDGHIVVDGRTQDDVTSSSVRVGAGDSSMNVHTADGSIHISTNGASN